MKPFQNLMQGNRNSTSRFQRKPGKYSISNPVLYVDPQDRNMDHGRGAAKLDTRFLHR
jgi:hypothetical protein